MLLSNVTNVSKETLLLILLLFMFLQVCASQAIFAEGHSVNVCCIFYLFLHNFLFCLFNLFVFKLARLLFFSRFTFIRSEMTPARAIQQSPSSFLEDSSTSSVHSSSQSLEVEAEREQRRLKRYDFCNLFLPYTVLTVYL